MNEVQVSPVTKVARDLTAIIEHATELLTEAVHNANAKDDGTSLPGGGAMISLAPVGNLEIWSGRYEGHERRNQTVTPERRVNLAHIEDEDDTWEPPLATLRYWSDAWRRLHNQDWTHIPTIHTEASFIRYQLDWAWDAEEVNFDHVAADIRKARARLEALLHEGIRVEAGVPCLDCNTDLIRPTANRRNVNWCDGHDGVCHLPHEKCPHDRGGRRDEWHCPSCDRRYDETSYRRAVGYAAFLSSDWLTLEDAIERTGAKRGSIQGWASSSKALVRKRKDQNTGRMTYNVPDIEARLADSAA